jgi:LacI family transcriptional regulator
VTATRERAFLAAMRETGAPARPEWVVHAGQLTAAAGRAACRALLRRAGVTAVLAGNDMVAVGCYAAFDEAGLRCPQDVSLVGINDMPLAEWMRPALTTVAIPQEELGTGAARLIAARIDDPRGPVETVTLPTSLIVRGSTARVS